jgi:hypothetical protein
VPKQYRLFVASPGDVSAERKALDRVVKEINETHGVPLKYSIELLRWETHTTPSGGRPQGAINDQIPEYNIFIGIMWRRFGTPTGVAGSGTEEEYRIAYRAWERNRQMPLMFYFSQKPFMPRCVEEIDQVKQVLLFRQELERKALVWEYPAPRAFQAEIRKHLCKRMARLIEDEEQGLRSKAVPDQESINELRALWDRMTPELQRAFSIAYNENRRAGDPGIQTRDLFAAMLRVAGKELAPIVSAIPKKALPEAVDGPVIEQPYVVEEQPWLSHCVASSVRRLRRALPNGRDLTAADVFADIAKNGSGESVALLRKHRIGPEKIDEILTKKHLNVLSA